MILVSQFLLWGVVILQSIAIVALARQVGVLHGRISPVGALSMGKGPEAGQPAPELAVKALSGETIRLGGAHTNRRLLFFASPTCPVCKTLLPTARSVASQEDIELLVIGDGDQGELEDMAGRHKIDLSAFVNSPNAGRVFHVGKLPFACLLDRNGTIVAQGLVNTREHVESLIVADEMQVASIQQYLRTNVGAGT